MSEERERYTVDDFGMDDQARCGECGSRLEIVRPGKYQCLTCDALGALLIELESSALAWRSARDAGYGNDSEIGLRVYQRLQAARKAVMSHTARLRTELDECKQYEEIAIDNAHTKDAVMQAHRDEIVRLRGEIAELRAIADAQAFKIGAQAHELDRFVLTADETDTIEVLIQRLRRTMSDGELYGIDEQDAQMRYMLRSTFAALMADVRTFRADIERIGRERDQMVAANVELQERLSRMEDDGK